MGSDEQASGEVPGGEPGTSAGSVHEGSVHEGSVHEGSVHDGSADGGSLPVHDLLAGVAAMNAATVVVLEAARCAWSLSDGEVRDVVEGFTRAMASAEAARLAVVKVLDERPEAVPGASVGKVAAAFLTG